MLDEVNDLIRNLNKREVLPDSFLRMASVYYKFVSYINHTIALFLSEEYDNVSLFIKRADKELIYLKSNNECSDLYFSLCEKYISKLSSYMLQNNLLGDFGMEMLPDKYKVI